MFIESITVSGCFGVREASKFVFKREEEDQNFTELQTKTPVSAFSIVFDTKYGADYDLSEFIVDLSVVSTVEIVLWQCNRNILTDFKWLKENRMIALRDLKQPENIFINGDKQNIADFHNAIMSFGFTDNDGLQMHCLLREEITRLGLYTGDDLWNLIKRLNDCEHLVFSLERTHKKQQLLSKCFEEHVKEIEEDILPPNLKLLVDIQEHFKASKRFRTLTRIVDERKLIVLEAENSNIEEELGVIETKINTEGSGMFNQKALIIGNEMEAVSQNERVALICQRQHDLRVDIAAHKMKLALNNDSTKRIDEHVDTTNTLMNSVRTRFDRLQDSVQTLFSEEMFAALTNDETIKWKLALLKTAGTEEFESILQALQSAIRQEEESIEKYTTKADELHRNYVTLIGGFRDDQLPCPEKIEKITTQHHEHQFTSLKSMLEWETNLFDRQRELLKLDVRIFKRALAAGLNLEFVETLKTFDAFISGNSAFEMDYLGPMFLYLKKDSDVEHKFKSKLSSAMNIILFICGSTARKVHRSLIESNVNIGAYTLLGLNEFVPPKATSQPEDMDDDYISAESLVAECDFKSTLTKVFRKCLLANDIISPERNIANDGMEYLTYARSGVSTQTKSCFTFESVLPEVQIEEGLNFINESQKVYKKIKARTNVVKAIRTCEQLQQKAKIQLKKDEEKHQSLLKSALTDSFHSHLSVLSILKQRLELQKIIKEKASLITAMNNVITEVNDGIEYWNEQFLVGSLQQNAAEMIESKELLLRAEADLEGEISNLEIGLEHLDRQLENFWVILTKTSNTNSSQQSLEVLENHLRILEIQLETFPRIDTTQDQLDALDKIPLLMKLRLRLYRKNSEKAKTGRALELCKENLVPISGENFDEYVYEQNRYQPKEIIAGVLAQYRQELRKMKQIIGTEIATKDHYGHLLEAVRKAKVYSESPEEGIARNTISSKVFPLMNLVIVKQIKDAVNNFQICFNSVMSRFIRNSVLFFYTRGIFDEIKHEDFNWENFDICRLKSMDFVVEWKKGRKEIISPASLQKVKGLLLIMHIINYMSIFKFIIIDECIFEDMDDKLVESIRQYLQIVSQFVQVLLVKNDVADVPMDMSM